MLHQNKSHNMQKRWEKRLALENLESRQLLSASPLSVDTDLVDLTSVYSTTTGSQDLIVSLQADGDDQQGDDQQGDDQQENEGSKVTVTADGTKVNVQFKAEDKEQFTVVVKGTDLSDKGKDVLQFKSVKASAKNISEDDVFTYTYSGKANYDYEIFVVNGKYNKNEYEADLADDGVINHENLVGSDDVTTLTPFTFVATPNTATTSTITFQQKNGEALASLDNLVFVAQFDGNAAQTYTVSEGKLFVGEEASPYGVALNDGAATITITGLQANTKQTFQVAQTSEDAISALSPKVTITTTKETKAEPTDVKAELAGAGSALVTWSGEADTTYTISYTYTNDKGKEVTKTANKKATVGEDLKGSFTVSKLLSNTEYTFSVSANKTKDMNASDFVAAADAITTPTVIPAPTLKKGAVTADSVTFQVSNWDKMEAALQEVDGNGKGGQFVVYNGENEVASFAFTRTEAAVEGEEPTLEWVNQLDGSTSTMVAVAGKKNTVEVIITGLQANNQYAFTATASSAVVNDNINTVAEATSKALKVKTAVAAYAPVENLTAVSETTKSMTVSWESDVQGSFIVTLTPENGKAITKTVKTTEVTITGLTPNTNYTVNVVVKADKNGKQSEAATLENVKTQGFELQKVTNVGENKYSMKFDVDLNQYSGRLDFTVAGTARIFNPEISDWVDYPVENSIAMFFGENAQTLLDAYKDANPDSATLAVLTEGAAVNEGYPSITWNFSLDDSTVEWGAVPTLPIPFDITGTATILGGEIQKNGTDTLLTATMDSSMDVHFVYENE